MKVLITGGGGLIGQAIAKKHLTEGDEVYIYDLQLNKFNDYSSMVGEDLTDYICSGGFRKILNEYNFDAISNQAALVGVGQSQYKIEDYTRYNILGTAELLQALIDINKPPTRIIHAGSMGPYGEGGFKPVYETSPKNPRSIYAVTKQAQEDMIRIFSEAYSIPSISLRYFSVYSTDQSPLNPYTGVLSIIANQCLNSEIVEMYDDGNQVRDLIHVNDVAEAHFIASRAGALGKFVAINIATGVSTKLSYIAYKMNSILSPEKRVFFNGKHRNGDVQRIFANVELAKFLLKFQTKITIDQGIEEYCEFIQKNRTRYTGNSSVLTENKNVESRGLVG